MMPGPPPGARQFQYEQVAPPKGIKDVPRYVKEWSSGFFGRMLYIFKLVWRTGPWILFVMMLIALCEGVLPVVGALISKNILNELQLAYGKDPGSLAAFAGGTVFVLLVLFFGYQIFNSMITILNRTVTRIAGEMVVRTVKMDIMHKAKDLDLASYDLPAFYEKLENANREAGSRPIQILYATFSMVSTVITLISYVIILASELWWAALVMVIISVPSAIINFSYRKKNFQYMRRRSKDRRQMNYYSDLMVNKDLAKEVRMFDLSDVFIGRYQQSFDGYFKGIKQLIWHENGWHMIITVLAAVINCGFYAWFAYQVYTGDFKLGDYSLYTGALVSVTGSVNTLISVSATIYEGTLFIDNLASFLREKKRLVPVVTNERPEPRKVAEGQPHTFVFEHVSFAYPGTNRLVLEDVNMTLTPGETLVLVGLNGAGKTTLLKLLTRLYDPTEGRILLDGHDIREYDVADLYRMFGIIFQDFGKYAVTVSENIRFGDIHKEFNEENIRRAAAEANANAYIESLPDGYATPLMRMFEESATDLSIGQWQKLAIARAFYSDSDVLILDEPTASLDPMAEQEIFNQFDRLRKDKTTIFVSHRLSSATMATKIVVLEYGRVVEEGDHKTLMAKQGKYYELFSTQAQRYVSEGQQVNHGAHRPPAPPRGMPPSGMPPHGMPPQGTPPRENG